MPLAPGLGLEAGLQLQLTDRLRQLLEQGLSLAGLQQEQVALIQRYRGKGQSEVPYRLLDFICQNLRAELSDSSGGPWLHEAAAASGLHLPSPKLKEKSPELKARLRELHEANERREYEELVKDVTRSERRSREKELLPSYKQQLSFGLHVAAIMATCYFLGHFLMRTQFPDQVTLHVTGGLVGLIVGMLVEVFLFIIRTVRLEEEEQEAERASRRAKEHGRKTSEGPREPSSHKASPRLRHQDKPPLRRRFSLGNALA